MSAEYIKGSYKGTDWYLYPSSQLTNEPLMTVLKQKLLDLFANDAEFIAQRDAHYKSSWKQRGGIGAFMTICRPWDRFHAIAERGNLDIFKILQDEADAGKSENDDGTLHACIRDLRAYMSLLAVEAQSMRNLYAPQTSADGEIKHKSLRWSCGSSNALGSDIRLVTADNSEVKPTSNPSLLREMCQRLKATRDARPPTSRTEPMASDLNSDFNFLLNALINYV